VTQSSNKRVAAWAVEAEIDPDALASNSFTMEWPPNSGTEQAFPELDRAAYFDLTTAAAKVVERQRPLLDRLRDAVGPYS
jgi:predicted NUDIX family NTP pyrophosphohydrolase